MSEIADKVYNVLREVFPHNVLVKEHYVKYKGTKLFFDFYLKDLCFVEVQGRQHTRFVKYFHDNKENFVKYKHRDNLKIEYAQEKNISLVRFYYNENITKKLILNKIFNALDNKNGFYE